MTPPNGVLAVVEPYASGTAMHLVIDPRTVPPETGEWRVLRKVTDDFTGQDDPAAILVASGEFSDAMQSVADAELVNGTPYFYRSYVYDGTGWEAGATVSATPGWALVDQSIDVFSLIRTRVRAGLAAQVAAGTIFANAETGRIEVLNQPPQWEQTKWPVVTVHLVQDASGERALGEELSAPEPDGEDWLETQGWLSQWHIALIAWSINPDERIALRNALKRIVIGNLGIFAGLGIYTPELRFEDQDLMAEYPAPVYRAVGTFTAQAMSATGSDEDSLRDFDITINTINGETHG